MHNRTRTHAASSTSLASLHQLAFAILSVLVASPALALDDDPITKTLPTSFASPGARAAGMGGAFIGLADDSSAAFLNPAGITLLPGMELTIEGRTRSGEIPFSNSNSFTYDDLELEDATELSYLSFVLPFDKWGIGVFYGAQPETNASVSLEQGFEAPNGNIFTVPYAGTLELNDQYYGLGFGYAFENRLRFGASVYSAKRSLKSNGTFAERFEINEPGFLYLYDYSSAASTDWEDSDIGFNVGAHWADESNTFSVGLSYRSELKFGSSLDLAVNFTERFVVDGEELLNRTQSFNDSSGTSNIIPSALTLGFGWRPSPGWVVAVDYAVIDYSARKKELAATFSGQVGSQFGVAEYMDVDDGLEPRAGVEYSFVAGKSNLSLRGGTWFETDSSAHFDSTKFLLDYPDDTDFGSLMQELFPNRGGVWHGTAGFGIVYGSWVGDIAYDYSSHDQEFVLSVGYAWD